MVIHDPVHVADGVELTPVIKQTLDLWERGLRAARTGDLSLVDRELDWVIKRQWIESYMTRNRLSWRDPKISLMDLQYHDIRPDRGIYYKLAGRDMVDRITDDRPAEQLGNDRRERLDRLLARVPQV